MIRKTIATVVCLSCIPFAHSADLKSSIYGYIEGYVEKNEKTPSISGGTASTPGTMKRETSPHAFDTPNVVVQVKSTYKDKYSAFLNLVSPGASDVKTRNAWVETKLVDEKLKFRIGKTYRAFGLYNEILDAVPTFIGIEPPELLDNDHLIVTRTTNTMLHGEQQFGGDLLRYSVTTGNDEKASTELPLGGDVRYTKYGENFDLTFGSSFYLSNGKATPFAIDDTENYGGVQKWMKEDRYNVIGLYTELNTSKLKVQAEYFASRHNATRDGGLINTEFGADSALNARQLARLCNGNCATVGDTSTNYSVETWYVRAGYTFQTSFGDMVPYVQYDYYSNPEIIANKDLGGDNEAGLSDDGKFTKQTVGLVYRPVPVVALKVDTSNHNQKINGSYTNYVEGRFSFSYIWSL